MIKKTHYIILAILIIIIVIGVVVFKSNTDYSPPTQDQNDNTRNPISSGMRVEDNAIYVSDQNQGDTLFVNTVVLKEPGFVVIHKDSNGNSGEIIGAGSYLSSGEYTNINIQLTTSVRDGQKLYAMIHKDDGDQRYSAADLPVQSKIGGPVMMIFTVSKDAS